jgi:hypothetical protein
MKNRFSHLAGLLAAAITLTGSLALYAPSSRAQTSPPAGAAGGARACDR